ncbi:MAG: tetratricopeptide repeat protein [Acidobacteriota bacterium]
MRRVLILLLVLAPAWTHAVDPADREAGLRAGAERRFADAYRLLRPYALANPDDLEARLAASFAGLEIGRLPQVDELLTGLSDDLPPVRLLRGRLRFEQGEPDAAIGLLEPLRGRVPAPMARDLETLLADAYLTVGRADDAATLLEPRRDESLDIAMLYAQARYQAGDAATAATALANRADRALATTPPANATERDSLGVLLRAYGRYRLAEGRAEAALPALERACDLRPTDPQAWQLRGQTLAVLGRRDDATAALETFRRLSTSQPSELETGAAIEAAAADPTGAVIDDAKALAEAGDVDGAIRMLEEEEALAPDDVRVTVAMGEILARAGRREALDALIARYEASGDQERVALLRGLVD